MTISFPQREIIDIVDAQEGKPVFYNQILGLTYHHFCNLLFVTQDQSWWGENEVGDHAKVGIPWVNTVGPSWRLAAIQEAHLTCGWWPLQYEILGYWVVTCGWRFSHEQHCIQMTSCQCESSELQSKLTYRWRASQIQYIYRPLSSVSAPEYRDEWAFCECLPIFNACVRFLSWMFGDIHWGVTWIFQLLYPLQYEFSDIQICLSEPRPVHVFFTGTWILTGKQSLSYFIHLSHYVLNSTFHSSLWLGCLEISELLEEAG